MAETSDELMTLDHQVTINQKSSLSATMDLEWLRLVHKKNVIYHSTPAFFGDLTRNSSRRKKNEAFHMIDILQAPILKQISSEDRVEEKSRENSAPEK